MKNAPHEADFLVMGAGVAGLRAAIQLAEAGRVLVLTKKDLPFPGPNRAHPRMSLTEGDENEVTIHLQETLMAGEGLCNPAAAKVLVEEAPEKIEEVIDWAGQLDRAGTRLEFTPENPHTQRRSLHASGSSVAREILRIVSMKTKALHKITMLDVEICTDLLVENGRAMGIHVISDKGQRETIFASALLLANGGLGHLYRDTTNPATATGDGIALAFRAGAEISDMEFVQFHPTALFVKNAPRLLLPDALRQHGAYLRNLEMARFMHRYHPMGEAAPSEVVARAIMHEMQVSRAKEPVVYLDLTHLDPEHVQKRFPGAYASCLEYNLDIATELVPVRPAARYAIGGVRTDLDGRTTVRGLYAAGEVAVTGVHGANRLASNSLLEDLVFGARAGNAMRQELNSAAGIKTLTETAPGPNGSTEAAAGRSIAELQEVMSRDVGIVRDGPGLRRAIQHLERLASEVPSGDSRRDWEAHNLHQVGLLIARSALAREESRGAHYRIDFPAHNDAKFGKHAIIHGESIRFQ